MLTICAVCLFQMETLVAEMSTVDEDLGQTHSYIIQAQTPRGALKLVDKTRLHVADPTLLDFETRPNITLTVVSTDNGKHSQFSKVVTLIVPVIDINEPPTDISLHPKNIKENTPVETVIGTVTVQDPDIGPQVFFCSLLDDARGRVGLKQSAAKISLIVAGNGLSLNYERQRSHNIVIRCQDKGGLMCQRNFTIKVLDANDPPSNIIFKDAQGDTTLNPKPPNITTTTQLITSAVATVNETAAVGITIVTYVRVIDEDNSHNSLRAQFHVCTLISEHDAQLYIIIDAGKPLNWSSLQRARRSLDNIYDTVPDEFMVQPGTNAILVRKRLDYERRSNYTLYLKCTDNGIPRMSTVAPLRVYVVDVPEAPTDLFMTSLWVPEDSKENALVANLTLVDSDHTRSAYSFEITSRGVPFHLVGRQVFVSRVPLDHETTPLLTLQITVKEVYTALELVKSFDVNVTDVNEAPKSVTLDGKTKLSVLENVAIGYEVGAFKVEDEDKFDKDFTITITGQGSGDFRVVNGKLVTASQLNAWKIDQYMFKIRATDQGGLSTTAIFTITVSAVDACAVNNGGCSQYAICSRAGPGRAACACKVGFTGDGLICSDIDFCSPNPCHVDKSIDECRDGFGGWMNYTCNCKLGWSPPDCRAEVNECRSNPCHSNGTESCEDLLNGFKCHCDQGFTGQLCNENVNDCSLNTCLNGGTCIDKVNGFICICKAPFIGVNCDTDDTICRENPNICPRNGLCISYPEDKAKFSCRCELPWSGDCTGCAPGYGGANCMPCQYPWTGENCEQDWRNCQPNPCLNGGTCYPLKHKDFSCVCPANLFGKRCENKINGTLSQNRNEKDFLGVEGKIAIIVVAVVLLVALVVVIVVWRIRKRRKYRSRNARIEFNPKQRKLEIGSPFRENVDRNKFEFSNPVFIMEPAPERGNTTHARAAAASEKGDEVHQGLPEPTVIPTSEHSAAYAYDNPVYESADTVLSKHGQVTHNPLCEFMEDTSNEVLNNRRVWRKRPETLTTLSHSNC